MTEQILWIPGRLPGLNELEKARGIVFKGARGNGYNRLKQDSQRRIILLARSQLTPVSRAQFAYEFHEPDKRRDPSNIAGGGIKIIEDALQLAGIIHNDGWASIAGFTVSFSVDKTEPGVLVRIEGVTA